ncbi:MAG TPA: hypothetical protein VGX03_20185 [Candidatus Binatia bacterium]|jgi:CheY-like chemotaxis protein|nr:hypothetical protein [Candidatus Binatia bacterium]
MMSKRESLSANEEDIPLQYQVAPTQAIQIAVEISPRTILLDFMMPAIDGLTLVVKLPDKGELIARTHYQAKSAERVAQQVELKVELILNELQYNLRALQDIDPTQDPPALRDHAWQSLSDKLSMPNDLRTQIQAAYEQIGHARAIHQRIRSKPAQSYTRLESNTVGAILEGVKEILPHLITALILLL